MNKIILVFFLIFISAVVFAGEYTLTDKNMSLSLNLANNNNIYFSSVYDRAENTEFVKDPTDTKSLWKFIVKKGGDFAGEEIQLLPSDAESVSVTEKSNTLVFLWKNVKKENMSEGFDVKVVCELKKENSYWNIDITPNSQYGIWTVTFPVINDLDAQNGDMIMFPMRGGAYPITQYSEKGIRFPYEPDPEGANAYVPDIGWIGPTQLQYESFTKGNSTLYLSPEDKTFSMKSFNLNMISPNHLDFVFRNFPEKMGQANVPYSQHYKFNMAMVKGDWYDSAKKYRKWGIDSKAASFERGLVEKRKDIPEWLKYNCCWLHGHCHLENPDHNTYDSLIETQKILDVPCAVHCYNWSVYDFDTHYPNWIPARDKFKEGVEKLQKAGIKVMPYTNGHIADRALSPTVKELGDIIYAKDENGNVYHEAWAENLGADNNVGCIRCKEYYNALMKEYTDIFRFYNVDALYIDQIGAAAQNYCFDEMHGHPLGGGGDYVKVYTEFVKELKEKASEIAGRTVALSTEDVSEAVPFDMWLRVNDPMAQNADFPLSQIIFSGYTVNFGDYNYEFTSDDSMTAKNKLAVSLVSGNQIGWAEGGDYEYKTAPKYFEYFAKAAKARNSAISYMNFGEVVRKVNITNDIPKVSLTWRHFTNQAEFDRGIERRYDFPLVKTGSFNYKGKTCVVFTNISEEEQTVEWSSKASDLGLKSKAKYTVSQIYPEKKKVSEKGKIEGNLVLGPAETVMLLVE